MKLKSHSEFAQNRVKGDDHVPRMQNKNRRVSLQYAFAYRNDVHMISLNINGKPHQIDVTDDMPLLWAVRDVVGLTGTKFGCGMALCGACTVHVDGQPTRSCITPVSQVVGKNITTIEAIDQNAVGKRIQAAWRELDVVQCGYCQSGQIMSATALLTSNAKPSDADIDAAMSGNICRCGTYPRIKAAIRHAAGISIVAVKGA